MEGKSIPERPIFTDSVPLSMMISYFTSTYDSMSLRLLAGLFGPPSCGWLDILLGFLWFDFSSNL
jgi:hypothetical protein